MSDTPDSDTTPWTNGAVFGASLIFLVCAAAFNLGWLLARIAGAVL